MRVINDANKNSRIEKMVIGFIAVFTLSMIFLYSLAYCEYKLLSKKIEGELTIIDEGYAPSWYRHFSASRVVKAEILVSGRTFYAWPYVTSSMSDGANVSVVYGEKTGLVYVLEEEGGQSWRVFSYLNIGLLILMAIYLLPVIRELHVYGVICVVIGFRLLQYIL